MSAPAIVVRTSFEELISDASLGLEYLDAAKMLDQPDRKWNSVQNARKAFDSVETLRTQHALTSLQAEELGTVMQRLNEGLANFAS